MGVRMLDVQSEFRHSTAERLVIPDPNPLEPNTSEPHFFTDAIRVMPRDSMPFPGGVMASTGVVR